MTDGLADLRHDIESYQFQKACAAEKPRVQQGKAGKLLGVEQPQDHYKPLKPKF